jgi:hypothetical protein
LVGQAKLLATASYFVGCDSGFAHIAGMLEIDGLVLFGNTVPADVIGEYPTLRGVDCFERLGLQPSRSLKPDDSRSRVLMDAIMVDDVVRASPLRSIDCTRRLRGEEQAMQAHLAVVGPASSELLEYLAQHYEITQMSNVPEQGTEFDAVVEVRETCCRIRIRNDIEVTVSIADFDDVRRALRENLNR